MTLPPGPATPEQNPEANQEAEAPPTGLYRHQAQ